MSGLRELKKRLKSIKTTEQLAGAMKTVSAAKLSQVNAVLDGYRKYAAECAGLSERFGTALSESMPCANPDAPICYVVFSANRGLCGGYNSVILEYADEVLAKSDKPYILYSCGKTAATHFEKTTRREIVLPDVPNYADVEGLCDELCRMYENGEVSAVCLIYQKFVNMLTQTPTSERLLPPASTSEAETDDNGELYIPDRETVIKNLCKSCVTSALYSAVLEASAGAQAATLMAMRSAYDNARDSSSSLETLIGRKRQSEVTAGVLETASDKNSMTVNEE